MASVVRWASIKNFHNLRRDLKKNPEWLPPVTVRYQAKVKLHGTNAAIQLECGKEPVCQSRDSILTPTKDNMGFAAWAEENKLALKEISDGLGEGQRLVVFGEWAGPKIQRSTAVSQIPNRIFAVFAIRIYWGDHEIFVSDPRHISLYLKHSQYKQSCPSLHVLPWYKDEEYNISWDASIEDLQSEIDRINAEVALVEACDPWVKSVFGIEGIGEGLVFYPRNPTLNDYSHFESFGFKAKGAEHQVVAHSKPVQADATKSDGATEYAKLVCTISRMRQGAGAVSQSGEISMKYIGAFLKWLAVDLEKETGAEIEASGCNKKVAISTAQKYAKVWYLEQIEAGVEYA